MAGSDKLALVSGLVRTFFALGLVALGLSLGYRLAEHRPADPRGSTRQLLEGAQAANGPVSEAVRGSLAIADPLARVASLAGLLAVVPPSAKDQVVDAFDAYFLESYEVEQVLLAEWWAQFDPAAAFAWTRESHKARHPRIVMTAVEAWARQDPHAALAEVFKLPELGKMQEAGQVALVAGWDDSGEPGLLDYLIAFPRGTLRQAMLDGLVRRRLLRDGFDATVTWAEGIPENATGEFKQRLWRRVVKMSSRIDFEMAAELARSWAPTAQDPSLVRLAALAWARDDPRAALEWLSGLQLEGRLTEPGIRESYRVWLSQDRETALGWFLAQPARLELEPAGALYAMSLSKDEPEQALALAEQLQSEMRRQFAWRRILNSWHQRDSVAAEAWMEQAAVPEEERVRARRVSGGKGDRP